MFTLRPYQHTAVECVLDELETQRSTLLVLPTGCGKTVVFCEVIRRFLERGQRALVLAHRDELLKQAADKLAISGISDVGFEKASDRENGESVVVGSVQTLRGSRLQRFAPDTFGLIVLDECQHARSDGNMAIAKHFTNARILGVTATPDRLDGKGLGEVFKTCAHKYELFAAIQDGWLVPIKCRQIEVEGLDLRKVRTTAGDLNARDLEAIMSDEHQLHKVAFPLVEQIENRQTIVFGVTVKHAEALAEVINRYRPDSAQAVSGVTPMQERRAILRAFEQGQFQTLVNCALLTEGFDMPPLACVAVARPTKSRGLYVQMIGRGTRPLPGVVDGRETAEERRNAIASSAKPDLLILDFVGVTKRHELVSARDVLASDEELIRASEEFNDAHDGQPQVGTAPSEHEVSQLGNAVALTAEARFLANEIDLFLPQRTKPIGAWTLQRATAKQIDTLRRHGLEPPATLSRGEASSIIDGIFERRRLGLASLKQVKLLQKNGHPEAYKYTIVEASRHIQRLYAQWAQRRRSPRFGNHTN